MYFTRGSLCPSLGSNARGKAAYCGRTRARVAGATVLTAVDACRCDPGVAAPVFARVGFGKPMAITAEAANAATATIQTAGKRSLGAEVLDTAILLGQIFKHRTPKIDSARERIGSGIRGSSH